MALSKYVEDEAYKNLLRDVKLETRSYEDVARDWEENSSEWFHALIAIEDLPDRSRNSGHEHLRMVSV